MYLFWLPSNDDTYRHTLSTNRNIASSQFSCKQFLGYCRPGLQYTLEHWSCGHRRYRTSLCSFAILHRFVCQPWAFELLVSSSAGFFFDTVLKNLRTTSSFRSWRSVTKQFSLTSIAIWTVNYNFNVPSSTPSLQSGYMAADSLTRSAANGSYKPRILWYQSKIIIAYCQILWQQVVWCSNLFT